MDRTYFEREWKNLLKQNLEGNTLVCLNEIITRYSEPHRAYHNLQHLRECLEELTKLDLTTNEKKPLAFAIWFHDVIYNPEAADNEEQSASFAREWLAKLNIPSQIIEEIAQLVLATKHLLPPGTRLEKMLIDIDLAILGQPATRFDEYERQIRKEYAFVPSHLFKEKRADILRRFLAREKIYSTESFASKYEVQARTNLQQSIQRLTF